MGEQLEIRATQFNKEEMNRILGVLRETDPRSRDYVQVLDSFERFLYFGNVIAAAQDLIYGMQDPPPYGVGVKAPEPDNIIPFSPPIAEEEKFQEAIEETPEPAEEIDPAVVKSLITKARSEKKISSVKDWLQANWGVDGFSAVPAAKYPEVLAKLKEIGVG